MDKGNCNVNAIGQCEAAYFSLVDYTTIKMLRTYNFVPPKIY